jgi:hypothetical protein
MPEYFGKLMPEATKPVSDEAKDSKETQA